MYGAFTFSDDRKAIQEAALKIFLHDHTDLIKGQIRARYTDAQVDKYAPYVNPTRNPLRRCAELQAVMYQRSPRITSPDNEQIALDIIDYTPDLYQTLAYAQKMAFAVGDLFIVPYWDPNAEKVRLDLLPPHITEVTMERSTVKSISFKKFAGNRTRNFSRITEGEGYAYYQDRDAKGKLIGQAKPMEIEGVFPVVWVSVNPVHSICTWSTSEIIDLVNGTIQVGELEAFHDSTNILKSFKQMYHEDTSLADPGTGEGVETMQVDMGAQTVISGRIGAEYMADPDDPFLETIQRIEADLAATRGISSITYHQGQANKDEANTTTDELRQRWRKQVKVFEPYERQLYKVILAVLNSKAGKNYDLDSRINIDYFEPEELDDYGKALDNLTKEIALSISTPPKFLYKYNPGIRTTEEAEDVVQENVDWRDKWSRQMSAGNISKDPLKPSEDPTVNGAQGKGASGPQNPRSMQFQQEENDGRSSDLNNSGEKE